MLQSMTGYGKVSCDYNNKKIVIEIKTLNSKQLDITSRIAGIYRDKDIEFRNLMSGALVRGKVDFSLYIDDTEGHSLAKINQRVVQFYYDQIKQSVDMLGEKMPEDIVSVIMKMPEVLKSETPEVGEEEMAVVFGLLQDAFVEIKKFRVQEGRVLQDMFNEKIKTISGLIEEVEAVEGERIVKIRERLEEGLKNLEDKIMVDNNRLEQELIYYIEKLDVNEEKVRLRNHLKYFVETMEGEEAAGKKLGFIAQEMGREINTLGSKSNHSEMQKIVVRMKDELEQIKEQVLNIL